MKQILKGYHYTSKENWDKIQKDGGIKTYDIKKDEFTNLFPNGIHGVWLWDHNPKGVSHVGNIIYQISSKASTEIVKLEVNYSLEDRLKKDGQLVQMFHSGTIGGENGLHYHKGKDGGDTSIVLTAKVPLQNIRQVGYYNTVQMLQ